MERKTAHNFDQELLVMFDAYVHGGIDRRTFLDKAAKYAVGGVTAAMLLEQCLAAHTYDLVLWKSLAQDRQSFRVFSQTINRCEHRLIGNQKIGIGAGQQAAIQQTAVLRTRQCQRAPAVLPRQILNLLV